MHWSTYPLAELIWIDPDKKKNLKPTFLLCHVLEAIRIASTAKTRDINPYFRYKLCTNLKTIKEWLDYTSPLALDTETKNLARVTNTLATIQLSRGNNKTIVIPLLHPEYVKKVGEEKAKDFTEKVYELFKYWLENGTFLIVGANLKYDMIQLCVAVGAEWLTHPLWQPLPGNAAAIGGACEKSVKAAGCQAAVRAQHI